MIVQGRFLFMGCLSACHSKWIIARNSRLSFRKCYDGENCEMAIHELGLQVMTIARRNPRGSQEVRKRECSGNVFWGPTFIQGHRGCYVDCMIVDRPSMTFSQMDPQSRTSASLALRAASSWSSSCCRNITTCSALSNRPNLAVFPHVVPS